MVFIAFLNQRSHCWGAPSFKWIMDTDPHVLFQVWEKIALKAIDVYGVYGCIWYTVHFLEIIYVESTVLSVIRLLLKQLDAIPLVSSRVCPLFDGKALQ